MLLGPRRKRCAHSLVGNKRVCRASKCYFTNKLHQQSISFVILSHTCIVFWEHYHSSIFLGSENHFLLTLFLFSQSILEYFYISLLNEWRELIDRRDAFSNLYIRVKIAIMVNNVLFFSLQVHVLCAHICLLAHLHSDYSCSVSATSKANAAEEKIDSGDFSWVHEHQEALRKLSISACFPNSPNRRNSTGHAKFNSQQGHNVRKRYTEHKIQNFVLESMLGVYRT